MDYSDAHPAYLIASAAMIVPLARYAILDTIMTATSVSSAHSTASTAPLATASPVLLDTYPTVHAASAVKYPCLAVYFAQHPSSAASVPMAMPSTQGFQVAPPAIQ